MSTNLSTHQRVNKVSKNGIPYFTVAMDDGTWLSSQGSDFVFAYVKNAWDPDTKAKVGEAFEDALDLPNTIKEAVKNTSGDEVLAGVYILDKDAMIKAMNSIQGMAETSASTNSKKGEGTAASINEEFFQAVLAGLKGDVSGILDYLNQEMGGFQAQLEKTTTYSSFGSNIGMISAIPELGVVTTSFSYAFSSSETGHWMVNVNCGSVEHYSYDYE